MLIGNNTEFYKDVKPGDLVRLFGKTTLVSSTDESTSTYKDFIVTKIESNTCIHLNDAFNYNNVDFNVDNSLMYVIDYKTKEGIQYADIPFCSSAVDNSPSKVSFGDGSEIVSVGRILSTSLAQSSNSLSIDLNGAINVSFLNAMLVDITSL